MRPLLLLNVVGLTPALLKHAPRLAALGLSGGQATLDGVFPAVTTTAQASILTGLAPSQHGIVGNGWYFRDLSEILFWRQSNHLIEGGRLWRAGRARFGEAFTTAKMFWWYNMYADVAWSATPRPSYPADGRKIFDIYTEPPALRADLTQALGAFPFFSFWGPKAGLPASAWIAAATLRVMRAQRPALALAYLPHLDYDLQRFGPDGPEAIKATGEIDAVAGDLIEEARALGYEVVALSEYGITGVSRAVHINRALREAGWLRAQEVALGWELLDPGASRAFAVADHQIAHVYVRDPADVPAVKARLEALEGVDRVLDAAGKAELGVDHPRAGELIAISAADAWFTYYYWLDEARRPDFAPTVDIHRKPGYDPLELLIDPTLRLPAARVAHRLLKKGLGMRYYMDVISTSRVDLIRGSHGRPAAHPDEGPLLLSSLPLSQDRLPMTAVHDLILELMSRG
ncbi:alkaline phosphatase family protein [Myxococcota bacterium]|nr:alkaline phosphatase family protein [Myxococcota bacterium]